LPGLMAATASYTDLGFQRESRAQIWEGMRIATDLFDELGRPYVRSYGNFVFFDTGGSPEHFRAAMRRQGIMTGLSFAPYDTWARVSMGTVEQMEL
ncbi:MAG: aminotransferase, partial [Pseudomonas stutzeri]|nr:aminotransferase [Stutzerimonas stutzeri]